MPSLANYGYIYEFYIFPEMYVAVQLRDAVNIQVVNIQINVCQTGSSYLEMDDVTA